MNLFIDTNIYLTFYHYSSDDLEELKKLAVAIKGAEITLYLTEQVRNEFKRNRESKIADALKRLDAQKLSDQFPQMCQEYEEYKALREALKRYEENKNRICQKLQSDIENKNLGADKVIAELFAKATCFDLSEALVSSAKMRMTLGNPPGKDGSYGDAINWETLLKKMPKEDLYLLTDDKDYISPVNGNKLAEYLAEEWQEKKAARIVLYRKLSDFFRDKYPSIKLASELEKELAISSLAQSGSFQATHLAIAKLATFTDFTDAQIRELVEAAITNSQIFWISGDGDVKNFMLNAIRDHQHIIDPQKLAVFNTYYANDGKEMSLAGAGENP